MDNGRGSEARNRLSIKAFSRAISQNPRRAPTANLVLLKLPPYSSELNPMETVFQYPRGNRLASRAFADAATVAEACRMAWDRFAAMPDKITSIMRRA